ncbi:sigma-54-dependent transcriptional regulator [Marinigracilibium pacificum]|uniref:Sigma-54-dependent Fis family transcriptional regulator n=1 Tax=Marinigracilibium pacificum TaxID=2729599 RepID=A0A848J4N1_9BACT|nr:sigma-54 dependent transcriptional regulator [Marinigracilibium pacificum]NMM49470.1 sigma-54-dependent Fis family transcriptional regulator [Marinigracilibium pacificum]
MPKILVIDDDPSFNMMLTTFLKRNDFEVESAHSAESGISFINKNKIDLVLTDYKLPDQDGISVIKEVKENHQGTPVILMTHYADIRTAVKSIQIGAYEFVTKPVNPDELLLLVKRALSEVTTETKEEKVSKSPKKKKSSPDIDYISGDSGYARKVYEHASLVGPTDMSVLILGESGTGKEFAAKLIYEKSNRQNKPFIAVDCGALSDELAASELFGHVKGSFTGALQDKTGQFEYANGGTLFLDEIGNLSYEVQVKLLRALQEKKIRKIGSNSDIDIDVRIITATNDNLSKKAEEGSFRLDLYHRLNEFSIQLYPLRERGNDLFIFADHFLEEANEELGKNIHGFSSETKEIFKQYYWPGNLRELKNVIKRAVLLCQGDEITPEQLPEEIKSMRKVETFENSVVSQGIEINSDAPNPKDLKQLQETNEKETIERVLKETHYNKSLAAKILNIDRKTLYNKIKRYEIDA